MRTLALAALRAVVVAALVAWGAPVAHASGRSADDEATVEARKHVESAKVHFKLGEFDEAIAEWKEAYRLKTVPALLFNIAQAYRLAGNYKQSKFAYENYLRDSPTAANKDEVLRQIEQLSQLIAEQEPAKGAARPAAAEKAPVSEQKPIVTEAKPPVSEPKPIVSPPKPAVAEQKPIVSPPKPAVTEQKPIVSEPKPLVSETKTPAPETKPAAVETKEPVPVEALGGFPEAHPAPPVKAKSKVLPIALSVAAAALAAGAGATYLLARSGWDDAASFERTRVHANQVIGAADAKYHLSLGLGGAALAGGVGAALLFVF